MRYRTLTVRWIDRSNDHRIYFPSKADGHLIHHALFGKHFNHNRQIDHSLAEELERRGYDLTTLVFQCRKKKGTP